MAGKYQVPYVAMGWAWFGSPRMKEAVGNRQLYTSYQKVFQDKLASRQFVSDTKALASTYAGRVARAFNRTHGRSGKTASTWQLFSNLSAGGPGQGMAVYTWSVAFGGNIGFVINPIKDHTITVHDNDSALSNQKSWHPRVDRSENLYEHFPAVDGWRFRSVQWYQGGDESFSPDRAWYEDEQPELEAEALIEMKRMAAGAKVLWAEENSGIVVVGKGGRNEFLQFPPP